MTGSMLRLGLGGALLPALLPAQRRLTAPPRPAGSAHTWPRPCDTGGSPVSRSLW